MTDVEQVEQEGQVEQEEAQMDQTEADQEQVEEPQSEVQPEQEPDVEPAAEPAEVTENEEAAAEDEEEIEYIREPILDTEEMRKIFVGGISPDSKDEDLKEFFETISGGSVTDHVIIRKDSDKKSHFGFVTFESSELVDKVLSRRTELNFDSRLLDVNRAVPKNNTSAGAHDKCKKLFVANLPKFGCTEEDLLKYFKSRHPPEYGVIESVQLIKRKNEKGEQTDENKGFGFIVVSSEDMADKMAIQHATFDFGGRKIELKKSVPTTPNSGGGRRGGRGGKSRGGGGGQHGGYGGQQGGYGGYGGGYDQWSYGQYDYSGYGGGYGGGGYGYGGGYGPQSGGGRGRGRYAPY